MGNRRVVLVGLAVVVLAACGAGDDETAGTTTTTPAGVSTSTASIATPPSSLAPSDPQVTEEPSGGGDGDEDDDDNGLDSVQWGPDDPPIPGEYYGFAVEGLDCAEVDPRNQDHFWRLAAAICRVFTGEGDWADEGSVPAPPSNESPYHRCLDGELFAMLERALAWRDEHPGETPVVRYPASGTYSPCQTSLYDVGPTGADANPSDAFVNDEQLQVPTPGVPVTITAPGISGYANPQATVDGDRLCVIEDSEKVLSVVTFVVVVPTSGEEHEVTIDVASNYGTLRAAVKLPAVDVDTSEPSVPTTDEETTTTESSSTTDTTDGGSATTDDP